MMTVKLKTILFLMMLIVSGSLSAAPEKGGMPELSVTEREIIYNVQKELENKNYSKAVDSLKKYIDSKNRSPKHYLIYFTIGNALMLSGSDKKAVDYYSTAAEIYPEDASVWQNMGRAFYSIKKYEQAGDSLKKAYRITGSADTAYSAGSAYILGRHYSKALSFIEPLTMDEKFTRTDLFELLLRVYLETGKEREAIELAWKLLEKNKENPDTWKILSRIYIDKKDYHEAAASFYAYTTLSKVKKDELKLLYDLYRMAGAPLRAAMGYEKLIDENADSSLYEITAASYMEAHKTDRAIEILKKGITGQGSIKLQWMLAGAYYRQKNFTEAADAFRSCAQGKYKEGKAYLMAGYCALYSNDIKKSKTFFRQASKYPEQKEDALRRLKDMKNKHSFRVTK